jgi:hypothetical protein
VLQYFFRAAAIENHPVLSLRVVFIEKSSNFIAQIQGLKDMRMIEVSVEA